MPCEAYGDWPSVQTVVGKEGADGAIKAADYRHVKVMRCATVKSPDSPLLRRLVKGPECCRFDLSIWELEDVVFNVTKPAKNLPG